MPPQNEYPHYRFRLRRMGRATREILVFFRGHGLERCVVDTGSEITVIHEKILKNIIAGGAKPARVQTAEFTDGSTKKMPTYNVDIHLPQPFKSDGCQLLSVEVGVIPGLKDPLISKTPRNVAFSGHFGSCRRSSHQKMGDMT